MAYGYWPLIAYIQLRAWVWFVL